MHVPDDRLIQYRRLMNISRQLSTLGNNVSGMNGDVGRAHANTMWALSSYYNKLAQQLRVPGKKELARE
jgi:hypothetical protein